MNAVSSNALSLANAAALASANKGTFTSLLTTKQGTEKGGVLYGDDTVLAVIVTGFRYDRLVQRSLDKLTAMTDADLAALVDGKVGMDGRGKNAVERAVTLADAQAARDELIASFTETLNGTNESTSDHVYEPLVVTDEAGASETVRGAKVYKCVAGTAHKCRCRACTGDARAPIDGQINLSGLIIGSKVITPAANGPAPAAKSGAKTVAKDVLRATLPVARFVSYRLDPNAGAWILKAGGAAVAAATNADVTVRESALEALAG
jgi:hypothetical protein